MGQLVKDTDNAYFVAISTADNERQVGQVVVIPKRCVKEIREIDMHYSKDDEDVKKMAERYAKACATANGLPVNIQRLLCSAYLAGANKE